MIQTSTAILQFSQTELHLEFCEEFYVKNATSLDRFPTKVEKDQFLLQGLKNTKKVTLTRLLQFLCHVIENYQLLMHT